METQAAIQNHLLKKKNRIKLNIFKFLADLDFPITTHFIANRFKISEANLTVYLQELKKDLFQIDYPVKAIKKENKFIFLDIASQDCARLYYQLFTNYCEAATNYIILTSLLDKSNTSITKISQATHFSAPHVYSKMKEINNFLALYGITINFAANGTKKISGSEIQIQYCMLDIYWNIHTNTGPIFHAQKNANRNQVLRTYFTDRIILELNSSMLDKLFVIFQSVHTYFPVTSLTEFRASLKNLENFSSLFIQSFDIVKEQAPVTQDQRYLINLLARLSLAKIDSPTLNHKQYLQLKNLQAPIFLATKDLLTDFISQFNLLVPLEELELYTLNFIRHQLYAKLFVPTQPNTTLPSSSLQNELNHGIIQQKISAFYQDFANTQNHVIKKYDSDWMIEDLLHFYDRFKPTSKIQIGVNYTRDYYVADDLCAQLEHIFGTDQLLFKRRVFSQCDIIITDCPLTDVRYEAKIIYLLESQLDQAALQSLIKKVANQIFILRTKNSF
ncbi:helix-turn-helix domain-containing protein [Enterococcus sp. MJM12]|uniref:Helix-turn-helix domain-containing protein n=1 Tax=Candidatus Enterococcus myersii TaxID=2815322 RepID=A0ABS3H982_9ENTE|nr:helix-turn-helix domain-containing protein [Enterococcus sp. MJM12]MBO0449708.1 helix-turn-helix domain-containing protein [Enterococcus sp. MJM12]